MYVAAGRCDLEEFLPHSRFLGGGPMSPKLYSYLFAQQADSFSFQKTPVHLSARVFSYAKRTLQIEASFF